MARLFVSDLHLDASSPEAIEQFLDFLGGEARKAETLYILGDLFEAWIGDDDEDPEKERVCAALRALGGQGVACFALHGNRDFLLGPGFMARSGCRLMNDPVVAEFDGERVLLTHGDALCTDDHSYQELRSVARDAAWQRRFLALPRANRELLADEARAGSRRHIARTVPYIMDVNAQAVTRAFRATGVRRMIHGHTHRPGVHDIEIDGAPAQRIVLGAWYEAGSYVSYEGGKYALHGLPR
ncbi:MAG TPA: UDP-2,3-diacylglucosamine diphosphatase [Steroidobacteraceae bacterium]|nr:UDP-2,3-diacylglucosamine diphosphatase [Steroidobacteraceae bacterium]